MIWNALILIRNVDKNAIFIVQKSFLNGIFYLDEKKYSFAYASFNYEMTKEWASKCDMH